MAWSSQIIKGVYDGKAEEQLKLLDSTDTYVDMSGLYLFNIVCMFLDSVIICIGAVSLLKYTMLLLPPIEAVIMTMMEFGKHTIKKTMTMILLVYCFFGMLSHYILAYYQYGFFFFGYALLRSCIVFLNGFIMNEQ